MLSLVNNIRTIPVIRTTAALSAYIVKVVIVVHVFKIWFIFSEGCEVVG